MLPKEVREALWSYNQKDLDLKKHKKLIVSGVLNFGSKEATDWLFRYYGKKEVARLASEIPAKSWDKKSLTLWTLLLGIKPKERFKR